jgi:hypothetical protein
MEQNHQWYEFDMETTKQRNEAVEKLLSTMNLSETDKLHHTRWERLIYEGKESIPPALFDHKFGVIESAGDREALYLAVFDVIIMDNRIDREWFHREALSRVETFAKELTPVEVRELLAKEIAIAAARSHVPDSSYDTTVGELEKEHTLLAREKIYQKIVKRYIPWVERFRKVIAIRDDLEPFHVTKPYWQPKEMLLPQIDRLLGLLKLERTFGPEEKPEFIYELSMAHVFYPQMELSPGEALDWAYTYQSPDMFPPDYKSDMQENWEMYNNLDQDLKIYMDETLYQIEKRRPENRPPEP